MDDDERVLDDLARSHGVDRDLETERMARDLGLLLRDEALVLDDAAWSRVTGLVRRLGPVDKVKVWAAATGGLHVEGDGLEKARRIHRRLAPIVLAVFGMGKP